MEISADVNPQELWRALFDPARSRDALRELKKQAHAENSEAQWHLANWLSYSSTKGFQHPSKVSAAWLLRAADHGYLPAMVDAGHYLETTKGPDADPARAETLYRSAARRGSALAAWALGLNAEANFGPQANSERAYRWFHRAAELDSALGWKPGEYALAGIVEGREAAEGLKLLESAAHTGRSAEAEFYMGLAEYLGLRGNVDPHSAKDWFKRSASNALSYSTELGERCAHALLGRLLAFSQRTRTEGIQHLEIAASVGLPLAQVELALASLILGETWTKCSKLLRKAVQSYSKSWRQPGTIWLGVEFLTLERIELASDLLGQSGRAKEVSEFHRFAQGFNAKPSMQGARRGQKRLSAHSASPRGAQTRGASPKRAAHATRKH